MKIKFVHREQMAKDTYSLYFEKPVGFSFLPGQYIELLPDFNSSMDERGQKRWFTISSSPTEAQLTITTRHVNLHPSTFKNALFELEPGWEIDIKGPSGDFTLPDDGKHIIQIAGGIGVTPFHSQLKYLLDSKENKSIHLIYSNKTVADICFLDDFKIAEEKLKDFTLTLTLTDEQPKNWPGKLGMISDEMIMSAGDIAKSHIFISGPEPMVEAFKPRLASLGAVPELIHQDWFPGYTDKY